MICLKSINPFQLIIIATILTFFISDDKDAGELNVVGNLIVAIGSLVLTVAAQEEYLKDQAETKGSKESK